jgi:osmotically-inducible protein OsmY
MRRFALFSLCVTLRGCRTNETPEGQVDDLQIAAQMKSKLATDIGVSSMTKIQQNSTIGVATLSGQVEFDEVKAKAKSLAKAVPTVGLRCEQSANHC